jgi:ribonuclease D
MHRVSANLITTQAELRTFCDWLSTRDTIAFDTEFVSEDTYRPQLCLIQVASGQTLAVIDCLAIGDASPFWNALARGEHETVVHSGREEILFCIEAAGSPPTRLFDVQLAAGLAGLEYPAGYGSLINRLLGQSLSKRETRTDWRRRPLSAQQIEYAIDDVRALEELRDKLHGQLQQLNRLPWLAAETESWLAELQDWRGREHWRRVTGSANLSGRELAIVRELWRWREDEAKRRDCPVRRVLRDDLIVELARRRSDDPRQIAAVRGLQRGDLQRLLPKLAAAIRRGMHVADADLPQAIRRETNPHLNTIIQFLTSALTSICRTAKVAPAIVGTSQDVRDFVAYRLEGADGDELPALAKGWRAQVVGNVLDELLRGRLSIRVRDPHSDEPLSFEPHRPG